jgi:hypothetical protein
MTFPWKTIGTYAWQFAEYALAQKLAPAVPLQPQVPTSPIAPPAVEPPPAPVLTLEQKWEDRLGDIYEEEGIQIPGKDGPGMTERRQGYKLLEAGREDELRKNLRERK